MKTPRLWPHFALVALIFALCFPAIVRADLYDLESELDPKKAAAQKEAMEEEWARDAAVWRRWMHFNATLFFGIVNDEASLLSGGFHWDPLLYEAEDKVQGVRLFVGALLQKRFDDGAKYPALELGVFGSNRFAEKWRIEGGPTIQYWMTPGGKAYLGFLVQASMEIEGGGVLDRLNFGFQPLYIREGVFAQLWRLSVGLQF